MSETLFKPVSMTRAEARSVVKWQGNRSAALRVANTRRLWIFAKLIQGGTLDLNDVKEFWRIGERVLRRDIASLRDAGVLIDGTGREAGYRGHFTYRGFDPDGCDHVIIARRKAVA